VRPGEAVRAGVALRSLVAGRDISQATSIVAPHTCPPRQRDV